LQVETERLDAFAIKSESLMNICGIVLSQDSFLTLL